jgi:hypothetical protein
MDDEQIMKEELTDFEIRIICILRKKNVREMSYPGNITIHFDSNERPANVEKREIHS